MCVAVSVERIWNISDSQGQILALAFRWKSFRPFKLFPPCSRAVDLDHHWCLLPQAMCDFSSSYTTVLGDTWLREGVPWATSAFAAPHPAIKPTNPQSISSIYLSLSIVLTWVYHSYLPESITSIYLSLSLVFTFTIFLLDETADATRWTTNFFQRVNLPRDNWLQGLFWYTFGQVTPQMLEGLKST